MLSFAPQRQALAQSQPSRGSESTAQPGQQPGQSNGESARSSVRGCLMAGRYGYSLIDEQTATEYRLQGHTNELQQHRGHVVEIRGVQFPPASKHGAQAFPRLKVESIEALASTCPAGSPLNARQPSVVTPSGTAPADNSPAAPVGTPGSREAAGTGRGTQMNKPGVSGAPSPGTNDPRNTQPAPGPR
jgi:hypothetical protein